MGKQIVEIYPGKFQGISLTQINSIVKIIKDNSHEITAHPSTKDIISNMIKKWEKDTIELLNQEFKIGSHILCSLNLSESDNVFYWQSPNVALELGMLLTGYDDLCDNYKQKRLDYLKYKQENVLLLEVMDPVYYRIEKKLNTPKEQKLFIRNRDLERSIVQKNLAKMERSSGKALVALKLSLLKNESIKDLIKRIEKYKRNKFRYINNCKKISKEALRELEKASLNDKMKQAFDKLDNSIIEKED